MDAMTKEEQYKIAMIVLAGVCGVLMLVVFIVICCCVRYQRQLYGTGSRTTKLARMSYGQTHGSVNNYEAYAAQTALETHQPHTYQEPVYHHEHQGYSSGYSNYLALPSATNKASGFTMGTGVASNNPFPATSCPKPKTGNEYGRVLLNPPSAVCTKPAMPSTQLNGSCGTGGGCDGKFVSMSTGQQVGCMPCAGSQFVLESSSATKY